MIHKLIVVCLTSLFAGCGWGMRSEHTQDIKFVNNSSLPVEAHGSIAENSTDDRCSPDEGSQVHVLQPGEIYNMHLSTVCLGGTHTFLYMVLQKPYDVGTVSISNPDAAEKMEQTGFLFQAVNYDNTTSLALRVVQGAAPPSHPHPWPLPSDEQIGVAWISDPLAQNSFTGWTLFIAIPKNARLGYIALPPSAGISDLGGGAMSFQKNGMTERTFDMQYSGPMLVLPLPSSSMTVTCDDVGCGIE